MLKEIKKNKVFRITDSNNIIIKDRAKEFGISQSDLMNILIEETEKNGVINKLDKLKNDNSFKKELENLISRY